MFIVLKRKMGLYLAAYVLSEIGAIVLISFVKCLSSNVCLDYLTEGGGGGGGWLVSKVETERNISSISRSRQNTLSQQFISHISFFISQFVHAWSSKSWLNKETERGNNEIWQ